MQEAAEEQEGPSGAPAEAAPAEAAPEPGQEQTTTKETTRTTTVTTTEETTHTRVEVSFKQVTQLYSNKFYWETLKSLILFFIGLKIAQECCHIVIPIRNYQPFKVVCGRY